MKILKPGTNFISQEYTCPHCKAELETESLDDYRRSYGSDYYERESWDYLTLRCLSCDGLIRVETVGSGIPLHLIAKIKDVLE